MSLAFVDTETTGLDPDLHEIWEVGLIVDRGVDNNGWEEHRWFLPVDLGRADPVALRIGQFHERYPDTAVTGYTGLISFAAEFAELTRGAHLVGAVVSFDAERLSKLLKANGSCPEWHYHLIDVEALAVGYVEGLRRWSYSEGMAVPTNFPDSLRHETPLPWKSEDLSRAVGVDPNEFEKHTALGDARWAKAMYEKVVK